jgi:hypothetical protein
MCNETFSDPSALYKHKLKHNEDKVATDTDTSYFSVEPIKALTKHELSPIPLPSDSEKKLKLENFDTGDDEWVVNFLES